VNRLVAVLAVVTISAAVVGSAQQPPPPPPMAPWKPVPRQPSPAPSPVATDATPTPDPGTGDAWERWVKQYHEIVRVKKGMEFRVDETHAYPDLRVKALMEIVKEDDEYLYLQNLPLEDPRSSGHKAWLIHESTQANDAAYLEFLAKKYLIPHEEVPVPPLMVDRVRFTERSEGLPKQGLWQIGFDLADINRDGRQDLVLPPARKGALAPWVLFNEPDGWKIWKEVKWPGADGVSFDYGDVAVADFDRDGNLDIASANHFKQAYVLYGDGKGDFRRFKGLPRHNPAVTSRAIAVADFNKDGRPDVVQLAELDIELGTNRALKDDLVTVDLNLSGGWQLSPATFPEHIYGDQVTTGDFNGDGLPDILISSHKRNNDVFIFLNEKKGASFKPLRGDAFPFQPFVLGVAAASLDGKKPEQAVLALTQTVRPRAGEHYYTHGILAYRVADAKGKMLAEPDRRLVYKDQSGEYNQFRCLAVGDLDGDKRSDIVAGRSLGDILILLQMPDGQFAVQKADSMGLKDAAPNHVMIRDLEGDGTPEIVVNFSDGKETPGSVRVWSVTKAGAGGRPKAGS